MTNIWTRLGQAKARPGASNDLRCVLAPSPAASLVAVRPVLAGEATVRRAAPVLTLQEKGSTLCIRRGKSRTRLQIEEEWQPGFFPCSVCSRMYCCIWHLYIYIYLARRLMFSPRVRPYHGDQRSALRACSNSSKMPPPLTTSHSSNISSSRLAERCGSKNAVI